MFENQGLIGSTGIILAGVYQADKKNGVIANGSHTQPLRLDLKKEDIVIASASFNFRRQDLKNHQLRWYIKGKSRDNIFDTDQGPERLILASNDGIFPLYQSAVFKVTNDGIAEFATHFAWKEGVDVKNAPTFTSYYMYLMHYTTTI